MPEKLGDYCENYTRESCLISDLQLLSMKYVDKWMMYDELFDKKNFGEE